MKDENGLLALVASAIITRMAEPTTLLGLCLTNQFLAGVIGNLVASGLYDSGKAAGKKLSQLVDGEFKEGRLPRNHDLVHLAHRALRSALLFAHAACAHEFGEKLPYFQAIMQAWKENRLFDQPLIKVRDTHHHTWLQRLGTAIKDDADFAALDGTGSGLEEVDAAGLAAEELDAAMERALTKRLKVWVARHVESLKPPVDRQTFFEEGLDRGFPLDGDPDRRLTVYAAWCMFFREGLKDDKEERTFKAYVIAKLEQLSRRDRGKLDVKAVAAQLSDHLIEALAKRIPNIEYFDGQFKQINDKLDEMLELLKKDRLAVLPEAGRLSAPRRDFVGRAEIRTRLAQHIRAGQSQHIVGMHGQGGVGKTELALVLGHDVQNQFPGGQYLINLQADKPAPPGPVQAIAALMPQLGVNGRLPDDLDALVAIYNGRLQEIATKLGPLLLVLDNAASEAQVERLLPPPPCVAIVTSRHYFTIQGVEPESLDVLTEPEALELARKLCKRLTQAQALELVRGCDRLALAVATLAGAIANARTRPAAAILAEFFSDRLSKLPKVEAALQTSFELLDESLRKAWAGLSVFPASFPRHLAHELLGNDSQTQTDEQLDALHNAALLNYDPEKDRFDFHDLAREYAWKRGIKTDTDRFALSKRHASIMVEWLSLADQAWLAGKPLEGLAMVDAEMPGILAGQRWAATHWQSDDDACVLAGGYPDAGVEVLDVRLHSRTKIAWLEIAVAAWRKLGDRRGEGNALGNLGLAHAALGDARKAIDYYEQQLKIAHELGDRRGDSTALGNLGLAHAALGDARKAINYYEQVLVVFRELGDRRGEGAALGNLGVAFAALGDARKAIEYYEQQLKIVREIGDRRGEGNALGNLGLAHAALGDARMAIDFYEQRLVIAREIGDRRGEGDAMGSLGNAHAALGDARKAIDYYEQDLVIAREIGDRRSEGKVLGNLGVIYKSLGDGRKAIEYYERYLVIAREIGDRRGEGTACFNRAVLLDEQEQWSEAADDMTHAAEILAAIEDPNAARAAALAQEFAKKAGR